MYPALVLCRKAFAIISGISRRVVLAPPAPDVCPGKRPFSQTEVPESLKISFP